MIKFKDVSISYGKREVVHEVSFELEKGSSLVMLGANGCGKTTILKTIAGLLPYHGSIILDGKEVRTYKSEDMAKKVAYLGQMMFGDFSFSVEDTVSMGCYAAKKKSWFMHLTMEERDKVEQMLRKMDLYELRKREITKLSGGQLQRVFLARTFIQEPEYILLDEPTNHMDVRYQMELMDYLLEWEKEEKHTLIGVFHDVSFATKIANQFLMIKDGMNIAFGSDIMKASILEETYGFDFVKYMEDSYETFFSKMQK
jgi:iron complex transport system ATP-binding protein